MSGWNTDAVFLGASSVNPIQGTFTAEYEFAAASIPRHLSQLVDLREIPSSALLQYSYDVIPQAGVSDGFLLLQVTDVDDGSVYVNELFESGDLSGRSRIFETIDISAAVGSFVKIEFTWQQNVGGSGPLIRFDELQILY